MFREGVLQRFQDVFVETGREAISRIGIYAVRDYMVKNQGVPQALLSIRSGRLANAVGGQQTSAGVSRGTQRESNDEVVISDSNIEIIRKINVPYANIHEHGGQITMTDRVRRAMFKHLKMLGWYDKNHAHTGRVINIPARPYVKPAMNIVGVEIKEIVSKKIQEKFNISETRTLGN